MTVLVSFTTFELKPILFNISIAPLLPFGFHLHRIYFPFLYFEPLYIFKPEVNLPIIKHEKIKTLRGTVQFLSGI